MSVPSESLLPGEIVVFEGRPNWRAWPGLTIAGIALAPVVVGLVILLVLAIRKRSIAFKVTNRRIEIQHGWLSRQIDTVELWRVKDLEFRQDLLERLAGASRIVVTAHDDHSPVLELRGMPPDRSVYDQLMRGVMEARQLRGVLNVNS